MLLLDSVGKTKGIAVGGVAGPGTRVDFKVGVSVGVEVRVGKGVARDWAVGVSFGGKNTMER